MTIKRVALAGWFGSDNLGDELIAKALLEQLLTRDVEPLVVSVDAERTRQLHGVDAPNVNVPKINVVEHRRLRQQKDLIKALGDTDAMLLSGGIVQAETSRWNLPFHLSRTWKEARPFSAVGMGVGRVDSRLGQLMVRASLRRSEQNVVRDISSADRLRRWGLDNVSVGADPAFGLGVEAVESDDTFCVVLRRPNQAGSSWVGRKLRHRVFKGWRTAAGRSSSKLDKDFVKSCASAVNSIAETTGLQPRFVALQASRDEPLHRAVAEQLDTDSSQVVPSLESVLDEIGRSKLVVSMRYHGAVAALLHHRPAVLLDYSPKMISLACEGGGWASTLDPLHLDEAMVKFAVDDAFTHAPGTAEALGDLQTRLKVNAEAIDRLLGS